MIFDAVSGWSQNTDDASAIWKLAECVGQRGALVREHTCGTDLRPFLSPRSEITTKMFLVYSYGMSDLWHWKGVLSHTPEGDVPANSVMYINTLIAVAPVPRLLSGQDYTVWHPGAEFGNIINFVLDDTIPQSASCKNGSYVNLDDIVSGKLNWKNFQNLNILCNAHHYTHTSIWSLPLISEIVLGETDRLLAQEAS